METLFRPAVTGQSTSQPMTENETPEHIPFEQRSYYKSYMRLEVYLEEECPAKIKAYIDKHPLQQKSHSFFAELTKTDSDILHRVFIQKFHVTIIQYQLQKRMEVAANLLKEGRLSYKRIVSRCRYRNANSFSRAFKKVYKLTPTQYLKKK